MFSNLEIAITNWLMSFRHISCFEATFFFPLLLMNLIRSAQILVTR